MRRLLPVSAILAAVLAALWAWPRGAPPAGSGSSDASPAPASPPPAAPALADASAPVRPTLEGAPTASASVPRGDVVVAVFARGRRPFPGMPVRRFAPGGPPVVRTTGADGTVVFDDVPLDGSATVALVPRELRSDPHPVRGPRVELDLSARLVSLDASVVFAETGREAVPASDVAVRFSDDLEGPSFVAVNPSGEGSGYLHFPIPPGTVAWDPLFLSATVSPLADALVAVYPLRREARVEVEVLDAEGRPVDDIEVRGWDRPSAGCYLTTSVAGTDLWGQGRAARRDVTGRWVLEGVAWFPGQRVRVGGIAPTAEEGSSGAVVEGLLPEDPREALRLSLRLPDPTQPSAERPSNGGLIGIGGGAGGSFVGRGGTRDAARLGRLRVLVRRQDGTPARGATVRIGSLVSPVEDDGIARFSGLLAGRYVAVLDCPGLVPTTVEAEVRAQAETDVALVERPAGRIDVAVLDARGRPTPFARLVVRTPSGAAWVDLEGSTQRIDMFTDASGRRSLLRVEPGEVRVSATHGEWTGEAVVPLREGGRSEARIVVAPPAPSASESAAGSGR